MLNLQAITAGKIGPVNPNLVCSIEVSTGYTKNADMSRAPAYAAPFTAMGQVQSMTYRDLMQVDGLNLNGEKKSIYLQGDIKGLERLSGKGGDKITLPDGTIWLTVLVLETWLHNSGNSTQPGWCKVAVVLQNGS